MSFLKKISAAATALVLACGLMAPMAAWADDEGRLDAVIALGQSGEKLTIGGVEPDASSLLLELAVEPSEGSVEDLTFTASLPNARVDDVTVDEGANTVKVVLSAGSGNLFADASGTVQLGTISMKAAADDAEATVKVTRFQTMAASYASTEYPVDGVQAVYRVNSVSGGGDDGNGNGGTGGAAGNGQGGTTQAGYNPSSNSSLTRTGDVIMYAVIGLVVVAAAAGVGLAVRARKQSTDKEE